MTNNDSHYLEARAFSAGYDQGLVRGKVIGARHAISDGDVTLIQGIAGVYAEQFEEAYIAAQMHLRSGNKLRRSFPDELALNRAALKIADQALCTWIDYMDAEEVN